MPAISLLKLAVALVAFVIVAVFGPETSVHAYAVMVPVASVAVPVSVAVLVGKLIVWLEPALTTGGGYATVIVTVAEADKLLLSVTVSLNTYAPATRLLTLAEILLALVIVMVLGPETSVHA